MRVETENGLVGYGESISYGALHTVYTAVTKILAPMLRGMLR